MEDFLDEDELELARTTAVQVPMLIDSPETGLLVACTSGWR